jgi:hypothetical protein
MVDAIWRVTVAGLRGDKQNSPGGTMTDPDAGGEAEIITPIDGQPAIEKDAALHRFAARVGEKPLNYMAGAFFAGVVASLLLRR